jgi:hypothetical protein
LDAVECACADDAIWRDDVAFDALDQDQLLALVRGFKGSALYPIIAVAAFTGARRNDILALRRRIF